MVKNSNFLPKVRDQYERYPYPVRDPNDEYRRLIVSHRMRLDVINHQCFNGKLGIDKGFRVLTAGGGTGDALIAWAEQLRPYPNARVTYLDMSEASATIARKRADIRKLNNIDWVNGSLLNVASLDTGFFDFIDCAGVLHHLKDPDAGLEALCSVLKPEGALSVMVYAPYGRTAIYQLQNLMRLINADDETSDQKISDTREILRCLPEKHWFNAGQELIGAYDDLDSDAGLFDLLLHTQDRAYTILEVHEWLDRCELRMAGEPGTYYGQLKYLPETFIKDGPLLRKIKTYPLGRQQAIAEMLSGDIIKHEFYAVRNDLPNTIARLSDRDMIPWQGIGFIAPLNKLAEISESQNSAFEVAFNEVPNKPKVTIPSGNFIPSLLRSIDGKRSVEQIIDFVQEGRHGVSREDVMGDFDRLFPSLNRGMHMFLRHSSIEPFAPLYTLTKKAY